MEQRKALGAKGESPDVLLMTRDADPALARAHALRRSRSQHARRASAGPPADHDGAAAASRRASACCSSSIDEVEKGRQAYIVYPVIEESEKTDLKAATTMYEMLAAGPFATRRVALLHGRIPADERDAIMRRFRDGEIDVLVATTVIEVGIDVAERDGDARSSIPSDSASRSCTSCAAAWAAAPRSRTASCSAT